MESHKKQILNLVKIHDLIKQDFMPLNLNENNNKIKDISEDDFDLFNYCEVSNDETDEETNKSSENNYLQAMFDKYNSLKVEIINNQIKRNAISKQSNKSKMLTNKPKNNDKVFLQNEVLKNIEKSDLLAKLRFGFKQLKL